MKNIVVWDSVHDPYFTLAKYKSLDLFDGCQVICKFTKPDNIEQDPRIKIVIVDGFGHHFNLKPQDLSWADLVVCWTQETLCLNFDTNCQLLKNRYQADNVIYLTGGQTFRATGYPADKVYSDCLHFLHAVVDTNKNYSYTNDLNKPYLFDALLGGKKSFRKWIYLQLQKSLLDSVSLVSLTTGPYDKFYGDFDNITFDTAVPDFRSPQLDFLEVEDYLFQYRIQKDNYSESNENWFYSGSPANNKYFGNGWYPANLSFIIPDKIYANSWYSIISETLIDNNSKFITEKTAKCLLGGRIFIAFAAPGHLALLRSHGFKTFDTIIDESYDQIEDSVERFRAAWSQVEYLSRTDPKIVYARAKNILEHNHNLIINLTHDIVNARTWLQQHFNLL